ncbi:hypothetical protein QM012_003682 [Aureobasidium pullulans]|uniref:DUF6697 domain-containing protein n=1 Tax=Aureobasidium pullulans TaxID=5580 RepID=A0ABR0T7L5_AURPU
MADHLLSSGWNPYNSRITDQPLASSMHAVVPHSYMHHNLYLAHTDPAMTHQLEDRISMLQQQQFQDGLNAHFRSMQASQSIQNLQHQIQYMQHVQRSLSYDNSSLRLQVLDLQARQDVRDNEDCTRRVQLEPRSQEQKLESAMKNVNLMRIYAGVSLSGNATFEEVSLKGAEQMEALAKTLRSRVNRGGAAYLLEAEDAEAWAAKLREDAKPIQENEVDNKLSQDLEVLVDGKSETVDHADADVSKSDWDAYLAQILDEPLEWNTPIRSKVPTPSTKSHPPNETTSAFVAQTLDNVQNETWTFDDTASAKPWSANSHASHRSEHSKASSTVSIKIEPISHSNVSQAEIKAVPEPQIRKMAPHQKYATQQAKASKDLSQLRDATMREESALNIAPENEFDNAVRKAQVPPVNSTPSIISERPKAETISQEAQVPPKKLPPHRRYISAQQAEAPKLSEVELDTTNKAAPPPSTKINKSKRSKPRKKARKTEVSKTVEAAWTPEEYNKLQEYVAEKKQDRPKQDVPPSEKQNDMIPPPGQKTQTWQPSYLRELPLLPADELQTIPPIQEMHHFERSFILSHLGGTRWLPSFYSVPQNELSLLPGRGFYLLEDLQEPLAPSTPGTHGSLLTPILRLPEENNPETPKPESMQNAPLFLKQGEKYIYYGMYSYLRSDRLDIERCSSLIPSYLKLHWANQLTSPHRPKWVTEALQQHLCPPPTYSGPLPSHLSSSDAATSSALTSHLQTHESWYRDTHLETSFLRAETILAAFEAPDTGAAAEMPGIRFWCLGLRCEGWDKGFYDMMVREEGIWEKEGRRDGEKEREKQKEMLRVLGRKERPVKW